MEFGPEDTMKSVNLMIIDDMEPEDNESLVLTVSSGDPSLVISQRETTIIITDDDSECFDPLLDLCRAPSWRYTYSKPTYVPRKLVVFLFNCLNISNPSNLW